MTTTNPSPREANIYRALNQRKHQDSASLFGTEETSAYWTLSDLTIMYPYNFDINQPISSLLISKINTEIFKAIPQFKDLTPQPIHMASFKETYNAFDTKTRQITIVKNGTNQKFSPIVCEYLFSQIDGAEFEQAYFLCPNKQIEEIKALADLIKFVKIRKQTKESSNSLSSLTKHAIGSTIDSYSEIWSFLWCKLFNVKTMEVLRTKYNLKGDDSILEHMKLPTLIYTNKILQEILSQIYNKPRVSIAEIKHIISNVISPDRIEYFVKNHTDPAVNYTQKTTENTILAPINKARVALWQKQYPLSLKQK